MQSSSLVLKTALGLIALTAIAFCDLFLNGGHDFVNFDDYVYIRDNPNVRSGLSWKTISWSFKSLEQNNWHPLTWISLQANASFSGINPLPYHLTNLLIHMASTVLLFLVLVRATGAVCPAAATAALFGVHPLHVEPVAWATERNDVLCTFFWMLALLAYCRYAERRDIGRYLLVLLCMALGLMSKPMIVTLPFLLLLLDYWPLRRMAITAANPPPSAEAPVSIKYLILEKIPFFVLSACDSMITLQARMGVTNFEHSFGVRLSNALVSYVTYLRQMFWPSDLAVLYFHPGKTISIESTFFFGSILLCITALAFYWMRSRPYLLVGWLWYLGTLVPAIGLFRQVGNQAHADRYTYIPLIGIFMALSWGCAEWVANKKKGRWLLRAATGSVLIPCVAVTSLQLRYWKNSSSLWDRALQISGENARMEYLVAQTFLDFGEPALAVPHAEKVMQLKPDDRESYVLLGVTLARVQRIEEAANVFAQAASKWPRDVGVRKELAISLWQNNDLPAAYRQLAIVAELQPESPEGQNYTGRFLQLNGDLKGAVEHFAAAVQLAPYRWEYHCDLAFILEEIGDRKNAYSEFNVAFDINPYWPLENDRLARILAMHLDAQKRSGVEALRRSRQACLVTNYCNPVFLETLAAAHAEIGQFKEAGKTALKARTLAAEAGINVLLERLDEEIYLYQNEKPFREK